MMATNRAPARGVIPVRLPLHNISTQTYYTKIIQTKADGPDTRRIIGVMPIHRGLVKNRPTINDC